MEATRALATNNDLTTALQVRRTAVDIRRILVPTDFSEGALSATRAAIRIAQAYQSIITLAHASSAVPFAAGEAVIPDLLVDQLADDKERMRMLVDRFPALAHLHIETVVEYDAAVPMIRDLVMTRHPDLIAMGSSATKGVERVALGSVAESIARSVPAPVLIMGPQADGNADLFKTILVATDLKHTGLYPVQYASSVADQFHGQLVVLHVVDYDQRLGKTRPDVERSFGQELRAIVTHDATASCAPEFVEQYGCPAEQILATMRARDVTLVVLGARRSTLMEDHLPWTTLSHIVREAGCGVLVVPNQAA